MRHILSGGINIEGRQELKTNIEHHRRSFPDWREEIKLMIAEDNLIAVCFTSTGTNSGEFYGRPPTGISVRSDDMSIYRISEGKIAEQWLLPNQYALCGQLGLISQQETNYNPYISLPKYGPSATFDKELTDKNKEIALKANIEVWAKGDFGNMEEIFSNDFIQYFLPTGRKITGLKTFRNQAEHHRKAFPDWAENINLVVSETEFVALQFTSTGTNTGDFFNQPATGKRVKIEEMTFFRLEDGKIVEQWLLPDLLTLNQQLGSISLVK